MTQQLQSIIDQAWENRAQLNISNAGKEITDAVEHVIHELNAGRLRVSTRKSVGQWETHQWIKKAVLLSFKFSDNVPIHAGELGFYDKVPTKFATLKPDRIVRGEVSEYSNVRTFIKAVILLAEEQFDKAQEKTELIHPQLP